MFGEVEFYFTTMSVSIIASGVILKLSCYLNPASIRCFHRSSTLFGRSIGEHPIKNPETFKYPNQLSTFEHYKLPLPLLDNEFNYPVCRDTMGIRWPGYWFRKKFVYVAEMEPELVVPDLEGFELKPYVSYKAEEIDVKPFTARDLFDFVYAGQIESDFKNGKQDYNISPEEIDEARLRAMQTGSDLLEENPEDGVRAPIENTVEIGLLNRKD